MSLSSLSKLVLGAGKSVVRTGFNLQQKSFFSLQATMLSANRRYTDKHEWITVNGNVGTVGITDYAQDKLGEVVYVELPEVGAELEQAVQFATLESVKAVSECYTPVAGKVVEVNQSLQETPSQINKKPFEEGWLIKLELTNKGELDNLMDENQYASYLKSEDH